MSPGRGGLLLVLIVLLAVAGLGAVSLDSGGTPGGPLGQARWWLLDATGPAVNILGPTGPVSGTVQFDLQVEDVGPASVASLTIDGQALPATDSLTIDTTQLPDGPHKLRVTGISHNRLRGTATASQTFISRNTPPQVDLTAEPATIEPGQTAYVEITADVPVDQVAAEFDGRAVDVFADGDRGWFVAGIHPLAEPGPLVISARAVDEVGNQTVVTRPLTVTVGDFPVEEIDAPPAVATALDAPTVEAEAASFEELTSQVTPEKHWLGRFRDPIDAPHSSLFGTRRVYNVAGTGDFHSGTDYAADFGTPVLAPADGVVVLAEPQEVRGKLVVLDHGLGVFTAYFHLQSMAVEPGQRVEPGDLLGTVGTTGLSTGPHLHWEMRIRGVPVDATEWTERLIPPAAEPTS